MCKVSENWLAFPLVLYQGISEFVIIRTTEPSYKKTVKARQKRNLYRKMTLLIKKEQLVHKWNVKTPNYKITEASQPPDEFKSYS